MEINFISPIKRSGVLIKKKKWKKQHYVLFLIGRKTEQSRCPEHPWPRFRGNKGMMGKQVREA